MPLEVVYTGIPIGIVAVFFAFTLVAQERIVDVDDHPDLVVDVTGFEWSWRFEYPDDDVTVSGTPDQPPELVLPVDTTVRLNLRTADVIHSIWVRVPRQAGPHPAGRQRDRRGGHRGGDVDRTVRRVLRARPLADDLPGQSRQPRRSSTHGWPRPVRRISRSSGRSRPTRDGDEDELARRVRPGNAETVQVRPRIVRWLASTDHKTIGLSYMITAFGFFLFGGVLALFIEPSSTSRAARWSARRRSTSCSPCTAA